MIKNDYDVYGCSPYYFEISNFSGDGQTRRVLETMKQSATSYWPVTILSRDPFSGRKQRHQPWPTVVNAAQITLLMLSSLLAGIVLSSTILHCYNATTVYMRAILERSATKRSFLCLYRHAHAQVCVNGHVICIFKCLSMDSDCFWYKVKPMF